MSDDTNKPNPSGPDPSEPNPSQRAGPADDGTGEGFSSARPGNEYGAGARGYAGGGSADRGAGTGYGADPYGGAGSYGGTNSYGGSAFGGGMGGMPGGSRLLDDMARLFTDAAGAAQGVRREAETVMRAQAEAFLGRMDVVRRDEFEAVREVAARARVECEELRARLEALEARLKGGEA